MKPLLAYGKNVTLDQVELPCFASFKLDGIRCCMVDGVAMSRNEKPIPNKYVQQQLKGLHGYDGELILVNPNADFNDCQSAFMSQEGKPDFAYLVFDYWASNNHFKHRLVDLTERMHLLRPNRTEQLVQHYVDTKEQLQELYDLAIEQGYEGLVTRAIRGEYKHGRSTLNQQLALKLKPAFDAEALVVGIEPLIDQAGVQHEMLGKFNVNMKGVEFNIGTGEGLTHGLRSKIWQNRHEYIGKHVSFKYQELSKYGVPRFPSWRGFRAEEDL